MSLVIEIREEELFILKGVKSGKKINVKKSFRIPLKERFFVDGSLNVDESLAKNVKAELKRHRITDKKAKVIVNDRGVITKDFSLPKLDSKKMQAMVRNEMRGAFSLDIDYIVDYTILSESKQNDRKYQSLLASAIKLSLIESIASFFKATGLRIESIESAPASFMNLITALKFIHQPEPTIVIEVTNIYVRYYLFNGKTFVLLRSIYVKEDEDIAQVSDRVHHSLQLLSQSLLDRFGSPAQKVIVLGNGARFPIVASRCTEELKIATEVANLYDSVRTKQSDLLDYGNCLGAIL